MLKWDDRDDGTIIRPEARLSEGSADIIIFGSSFLLEITYTHGEKGPSRGVGYDNGTNDRAGRRLTSERVMSRIIDALR